MMTAAMKNAPVAVDERSTAYLVRRIIHKHISSICRGAKCLFLCYYCWDFVSE